MSRANHSFKHRRQKKNTHNSHSLQLSAICPSSEKQRLSIITPFLWRIEVKSKHWCSYACKWPVWFDTWWMSPKSHYSSIIHKQTSHILLQFSYPEKPSVVSGQRQLCQQAELIAHLKCWSPVHNGVEEAGCLCFLIDAGWWPGATPSCRDPHHLSMAAFISLRVLKIPYPDYSAGVLQGWKWYVRHYYKEQEVGVEILNLPERRNWKWKCIWSSGFGT